MLPLLAGALSAGGVVGLFMSVLGEAGGVGRLVAAPVVVPGWLLLRGRYVTHAGRRRGVWPAASVRSGWAARCPPGLRSCC